MNINTSKPIIVTSGDLYTDIDTYACILGYCHLLNLLEINSHAIIPGPLNESISKSVKGLKFDYETGLHDDSTDFNYIIVDLSDPNHIAKFVTQGNVIKIFDHHQSGFEEYWEKRLGENSKIEMVGSCATLIWEEFVNNNVVDKIKPEYAKLLQYAIISNTLNFKASVTHERDRQASEQLNKYSKWENDNWLNQYFSEVSESIINDPIKAILNDTKSKDISGKPFTIGQLELWDATSLLKRDSKKVLNTLKSLNKNANYFLTAPSISEGFNYLLTDDSRTQELLSDILGVAFIENLARTKKLYLRKELITIISSYLKSHAD